MMAGHVQSLLRIFLLYLTLAAVFKPHICSSSNNLLYLESEAQRWPFENDFGRIYYTILRIQFKRIVAASDKNISFPAFKITKHGSVLLALPDKLLFIDLAICVDVQRNPGPINGGNCTWHCSTAIVLFENTSDD